MTRYMLEVYYHPPADPACEDRLTREVVGYGGQLVFRDYPTPDRPGGCCLTYQFEAEAAADLAATALRERREHVEGPYPYF